MRRTFLFRAGIALAAALFTGALVVPGTAVAVPTSFYADSGDRCPYGVTRGTID